MRLSYALPFVAAVVAASSFVQPSIGSRVHAAAVPAPVPEPAPRMPFAYPRARMIRPPSPCDVDPFSEGGPGAPFFACDPLPRVGEPFRVEWTVKPTQPTELPHWPALLVLSFELQAPVPLDGLGAPGCHLMVRPDFVMTPQSGTILTQAGGTVRLDWTPNPWLVGAEFYSQLVVDAPNSNAGGILLSPVLHVVVGS